MLSVVERSLRKKGPSKTLLRFRVLTKSLIDRDRLDLMIFILRREVVQ